MCIPIYIWKGDKIFFRQGMEDRGRKTPWASGRGGYSAAIDSGAPKFLKGGGSCVLPRWGC